MTINTKKEFYEAIKNLLRRKGKTNIIYKDEVERIVNEFEKNGGYFE